MGNQNLCNLKALESEPSEIIAAAKNKCCLLSFPLRLNNLATLREIKADAVSKIESNLKANT